MRWPIAVALLMLTRPDGEPIWIVPDQVVSVTRAVPRERSAGAASDIQTLSGLFGVREEPAEIVRRLRDK